MSAAETLNVWWTYETRPRKAVVITFVAAWLLAIVFLYSDLVKILANHPWWVDLMLAVATVAVPILTFFELNHSAEANILRHEANELRAEANRLSEQNARIADQLNAERNMQLAQIAINTARPTQEPAAILKIHPSNSSRYILKPIPQGGAHGDFSGGHFQFWLRVENSGNRNSAVDKYKLWIQEFDKELNVGPIKVSNLMPGRHCQHGVGEQKYLNDVNLIKISEDDSTSVGCLWFYLPELTLEMFLSAGMRMEGPQHRFGNLHCRLTLIDSNGVSASGDFELSEA